MWLGAGWYEEEYEAYGYTFPSPKRRVDELEESLIIYKKIFTENETNFEGKFWNLKRHRSFPKPIQKPYPQIVIGTNGKRMIDIACREVDGINLPCLFPIYLKLMNSNISIINETLKKYNRDPSEFEISFFTDVIIVDNQERIERIRKEKKIPKSLMKFLFIGTPEIIREKIREVERLGVKKMVLYKLESPDLEDPLDIFKREIM